MPSTFTPDINKEEDGVIKAFTFERGQLCWTPTLHADTTRSSRARILRVEGEEPLPMPDGELVELLRYQALMSRNTYANATEAMAAATYAANGHRALCQIRDLPRCVWKLPKRSKAKYRQRDRQNREAQAWYAMTYDGQAQCPPWLYGHIDDTDDEETTTAYWQQPVTRSLCGDDDATIDLTSTPRSPMDLFCYEEQLAEEDSSVEDDDVFITHVSPAPIPRSYSNASTVDYEPTRERESIASPVISISSDDDEGIARGSTSGTLMDEDGERDCLTHIKYEEKLLARRTVRAAHLAVNHMQQLCEDEGYAMRTHNERLARLRNTLAERKKRYDEAKADCLAFEDETETQRVRKQQAKEAFEACLAATQRRLDFMKAHCSRTVDAHPWNIH
jgi:hypothetical protein